jgi:hypothetical protein
MKPRLSRIGLVAVLSRNCVEYGLLRSFCMEQSHASGEQAPRRALAGITPVMPVVRADFGPHKWDHRTEAGSWLLLLVLL